MSTVLSVYMSDFIDHQQTFQLLLCLGYDEYHCHEDEGIDISIRQCIHLIWTHAKEGSLGH